MAMTGILTFAVLLTWNWLKYPPASGDPATDAKTPAVSAYFERTWVDGEFKPALWSHYDNVGPRTTNLAEGWHNDLNSRFGMPHPSLRLFLDWLQKVQHEVQCSWPLVVHRRTLQCTPSWTRTWPRISCSTACTSAICSLTSFRVLLSGTTSTLRRQLDRLELFAWLQLGRHLADSSVN